MRPALSASGSAGAPSISATVCSVTSTGASAPSARRRTTLTHNGADGGGQTPDLRLARVAANEGRDGLAGDVDLPGRQPVTVDLQWQEVLGGDELVGLPAWGRQCRQLRVRDCRAHDAFRNLALVTHDGAVGRRLRPPSAVTATSPARNSDHASSSARRLSRKVDRE